MSWRKPWGRPMPLRMRPVSREGSSGSGRSGLRRWPGTTSPKGSRRRSETRRKLAAVLDGLANAHRDRGNLPRAREVLLEVLEIGKETGDRYTLAIAYHDLMTVEKLGDDLVGAIRYGWMAVQNYDSREGSLRALFDLAGVLRENGELSAAKDAYTVVAEQITTFEHRLLSLDALAFIAALQGDAPGYHLIRARMDEEGWEALSPVYRGQVLFYRGMSSRALGWWEESRKWLGEALAYAELHGLNKLIFDAEGALAKDRSNDLRPESLLDLTGTVRGRDSWRSARASGHSGTPWRTQAGPSSSRSRWCGSRSRWCGFRNQWCGQGPWGRCRRSRSKPGQRSRRSGTGGPSSWDLLGV